MLIANISLNIGETVNITLQDLIDAKLVDTQIKDLTTNQIMNPDTDIVMVTYEGNNNIVMIILMMKIISLLLMVPLELILSHKYHLTRICLIMNNLYLSVK